VLQTTTPSMEGGRGGCPAPQKNEEVRNWNTSSPKPARCQIPVSGAFCRAGEGPGNRSAPEGGGPVPKTNDFLVGS